MKVGELRGKRRLGAGPHFFSGWASPLLLLLVGGCAPSGYYYETGSFTPKARDACITEAARTGFITHLNAKAGQPGRPPAQIVSIENMRSPYGPVSDPGATFQCRATLVLASGRREEGLITSVSSGDTPPDVRWLSDEEKARQEQTAQRALVAKQEAGRAEVSRQIEASTAPVPIEDRKKLYDDSEGSLKLVDKLAHFVKSQNYRSDSVNAARPTLLARGYVLICNQYSYSYTIHDKGGHWIVSVE